MTHLEIRKKFFEFFRGRRHVVIPSSSLVPQNDPTTLFTGSGMQPLIPYLLGETHPQGKRLADIQKCFRAEDLEEVGVTPVHHTFFEMAGNWSLGDFFKKEQIEWALEFFVKELGLSADRMHVTVFEGDGVIKKDEESVKIWKEEFKKYGVTSEEGGIHQVGEGNFRIFAYGREKNWWERSGAKAGDPAGPDSEIFYDTGKPHNPKYGEKCHVNCDCRRYIEICNNVFMQYQKQEDGTYKPLKQKNVDVGYGLERISMVVNGAPSSFETDLFLPIIRRAESLSSKRYGVSEEDDRCFRVLADHIRASVMLISDGVVPSNKERGYMLRRVLRRALRYVRKLGIAKEGISEISETAVAVMGEAYPEVLGGQEKIISEIVDEEKRFGKALDTGLKKLEHLLAFGGIADGKLSGEEAFSIYETFGFPLDLISDVVKEVGAVVDIEAFEKALLTHREKSKGAASGKFKGGLEGTARMHVRYHTATHLLHWAIRDVLGESIHQMGSNITTERLRFDFNFDRKLTDGELLAIENLVNREISEALPVGYEDLPRAQAEKAGALHYFGEKYGEVVRVYYVGKDLPSAFSKEFCGGPHVKNTRELGKFRIIKEEAVSRGVRRIKAILT